MKIEITSWLTGSVLFEGDFTSIAEAVAAAIKAQANLSGANLHAYAQVSFRGHGECGRMLTALQQSNAHEVRLFCGCFNGSVDDLRKYIADGDAKYRKTRTLALDTVLVLLAAPSNGGAA